MAFTEFLRISDKNGAEALRYRQFYTNQASSRRSFYCPIKHAENVVARIPMTPMRRTLGQAEVVFVEEGSARKQADPKG